MKVIAFHGTRERFDKFQDHFQSGVNFGPGIYFTESSNEARDYIKGPSGYILQVCLDIQNPFDVRSPDHCRLLSDALGLSWENVRKNFAHMNPEEGLEEIDREVIYHQVMNELFDCGFGDRLYELKSGAKEVLEGLGFDGIHDHARKWWVIFQAKQAKIIKRTSVRRNDW